MRSGGRNEKNGGYHAVPPPASMYQNRSPRTARSAAADVSPTPNSESEKRTRRRPARRSKPFSAPENGFVSTSVCTSGDEGSCAEQCSPTTSSSSPYVQQKSPFYPPRAAVSPANGDGNSPYKNGRKNSCSEYELQQITSSPVRFTSPVPAVPTRFHSDLSSQLIRDPQIFPDHWPLPKVNEALQAGRVFSCTLRVNAHNRNEAYATIEGLSVDVFIDGTCAQNRAFEGDEVALLLDPPNFWTKLRGSNSSRGSNGGVGAQQSHSFIGDENGQGSAEEVHVGAECSTALETPVVASSPQGAVSKGVVEVDDASSLGLGVEKVQALLTATPGRRPTGKVVAILKKSPRRRAIVGFLSSKNPTGGNKRGEKSPSKIVHGMAGSLTLCPVDTKNPKMIVLASSLPESIAQRLQNGDQKVESEILAGYVDYWNTDSPFPYAVITHALGQAGELQAHLAAILYEHAVHSAEFPPQALACLPEVPWKIPEAELRKRKDLRSLRLFSIDPVTARDLDDALSVEHLKDGLLRVGVHIADVSYFVQSGSDLDKEAQSRSTTVYMIQQALPMLPRVLCEDLCSLNPGVDRLAFSVFWDLSSSGGVVRQWIGKTVIRSCCKLSYGDAQEMIDGVFSERLDSKISEGVSWDEVIRDVKTLHSVAMKRRGERFENGALRLDTGKLVFSLDGDGIPYDSTLYEGKESNMLVEEFMLLANMTVANVISRTFPDCALLRRHPEPNARKLKELEDFCTKNGFALNAESAAALHTSLEALKNELKDDPVLVSILLLYATKPMQLAKYFCTGLEKDGEWGHYALAAPVYTHFTSPIRRYPDVIVHRTLAAALEAEQVLQKNLTGPACLDMAVSVNDYKVLQQAALRHKLPPASELAMVANHCNERKLASRNVQDATSKLYLWTMLRNKQGLVSDACVVALGPKFMSLYVSKIAMERRLYYDEVDGLKVDWLENSGTLVLDNGRPKHPRKVKGRSITDVLNVFQDELDTDEGERSDSSLEPQALPLTLRLFSHLPVLILAAGGDTCPLDIGVRLHVTSYLV